MNQEHFKTLKSDTSLPPVNITSETEHNRVIGRKKKYIEMFGCFTEPSNVYYVIMYVYSSFWLISIDVLELITSYNQVNENTVITNHNYVKLLQYL